jgi:hypothetical protein
LRPHISADLIFRRRYRTLERFAASRREFVARTRGGPGPGHKLIQTRDGPEIEELREDIGEVGLGIDAVQFAGFDERGDAGPVLRALIMTGEECVFAIEHNLAVILPIPGRMLWSNIAGIRCTDRGCVVFRANGVRRVSWYT